MKDRREFLKVGAGAFALLAALSLTCTAAAAQRRFIITLNYDGTSAADVPTAVRISPEAIPGFRYADTAGGTDFEIVDETGNLLPYEIDTWNPDGESLIWVKVPNFVNGAKFAVYYGRTTEDMTANASNVWSNYIGVWHMNGLDASGKYPNSAGDVRFNAEVSSFSQTGETGKFGQSVLVYTNAFHGKKGTDAEYEKGGVFILDGGKLDLSEPFMLSGWFNHTTIGSTDSSNDSKAFRWENIFCKRTHPEGKDNPAGFGFRIGENSDSPSKMQFFQENSKAEFSYGEVFENGPWYHFSFVSGESSSAVWINGKSIKTLQHAGEIADNDLPLVVGNVQTAYLDNEGDRAWGGCADEIRLFRGAPSSAYIAAEYASMSNEDIFSYGEVSISEKPSVSSISETSATASLAVLLAGDGYVEGSVKAIFENCVTKERKEIAVADAEHPSVTATDLSADSDYDVWFVAEKADGTEYKSEVASFVTAGRPTLDPKKYRKYVTFSATGYDGTETLRNFPVLVHLSSETVPGFSYEDVDPSLIRFAAADGTLLAHEIEKWNPEGLSTIWVALPSLAGTTTSFTMHWNPRSGSGVAAQPTCRVWKYAGYVGVWHVAERVSRDGKWCYPDSSGNGYTLLGSWDVAAPTSDASFTANGSPWTADGARARTTNTVDWAFSRTGYSVEAWINTRDKPGYTTKDDGSLTSRNGYMFSSVVKVDNGAEKEWSASNGLQYYMTHVNMLGGTNVFSTKVTGNPQWSDDATNDWHFVSAVWMPENTGMKSWLYEAGENYSSHGVNLRLLQTIDRRAIDFTDKWSMGIFASSDNGGNGCYYDEARVRRGLSSKDWIQAVWDTQRVGTDFLTASEVKSVWYGMRLIFR